MILIADDPDHVGLPNRRKAHVFYIINLKGDSENAEDQIKCLDKFKNILDKKEIHPQYHLTVLKGLPLISVCHSFDVSCGRNRVIIWEEDPTIKNSRRMVVLPWAPDERV